jgi:hypothetical protein
MLVSFVAESDTPTRSDQDGSSDERREEVVSLTADNKKQSGWVRKGRKWARAYVLELGREAVVLIVLTGHAALL